MVRFPYIPTQSDGDETNCRHVYVLPLPLGDQSVAVASVFIVLQEVPPKSENIGIH